MKKSRKPMIAILSIACIVLAAVLLYCLFQPDSTLPTAVKVEETGSDLEDVSLSLTSWDLSPQNSFFEVTIENNGDAALSYGEYFLMEREENGAWVSCAEDDLAFTDIGLTQEANSSNPLTCSLQNWDLSRTGRYRFQKDVNDGTVWFTFSLT